jgi:hypothetical protein
LTPEERTAPPIHSDSEAKYVVPSVIVAEGKSASGPEAFAVFYDFLRNVEKKFIRSQKRKLVIAIVLLAAAIAATTTIFVLGLYAVVIGVFLVVASAVVFALFYRSKPSSVSVVQKVYWPFAVSNVEGSDGPVVAVDLTGRTWVKEERLGDFDAQKLSSAFDSLPPAIENFDREIGAVKELQTMSESMSLSQEDSVIQKGSAVSKLIQLAEPTDVRPTSLVPTFSNESADEIFSKLRQDHHVASAAFDYLPQLRTKVAGRVGAYRELLQKLLSNEETRMDVYLSNFQKEAENLPTFFDPVIENFSDDISDQLSMIERAAKREQARIEDQMRSDQLTLQSITDAAINELEGEIRQIKLQIKLTQTQQEALSRVQQTMQEAVRFANQEVSNAIQNVENAELEVRKTQEALEAGDEAETSSMKGRSGLRRWLGRKSEEAGDEEDKGQEQNRKDEETQGLVKQESSKTRSVVKVESAGTRAVVRAEGANTRRQVAEMELRHYTVMTEQVQAQLDAVNKQIVILESSISEVADRIRYVYEQMKQRITSLTHAGTERLQETLQAREQDLELVRRHLLYLQDARDFVIGMTEKAYDMLSEDANRHLDPFKARLSRLAEAETKLTSTIDTGLSRSNAEIDEIKKESFQSQARGIMYVPLWVLGSSVAGKRVDTWYPPSTVEKDGRLVGIFPELQLSEHLSGVKQETLTGVDAKLLASIRRSRSEYSNIGRANFIDALICTLGAKNLAR